MSWWQRRQKVRAPRGVVIRNFVTLSLSKSDSWMKDIVAMQAFIGDRKGKGHRVRVAAEDGKQTLFCTCGIDDLGQGTAAPPTVYQEEDLFDSP